MKARRLKCMLPPVVVIILGLLAGWGNALHARGEALPPVNIRADLILASQRDAPVDPRLRAYESRLRKIFPFRHYALVERGATRIAPGRSGRIDFGDDYRLELTPVEAQGRRLRMDVVWKKERKVLVRTTLNLSPDTPAVLGGPRYGEGNLIVILDPSW